MKTLRKALVISVMFVTVLSMSVVVAPQADAAASAGDLIKMNGLSSVYYLAADGKRYVFPNESTYSSWYSDFSGVMTIPQSELESYPLGKNITVRPGTKLVKITTDPKVYAVEPNGNLVHVASEAAATTLYGSNWASRVIDVADGFFTNYTVSSKTLDGTAYPTGSLIKSADSATVYYIDADGKARAISSEAALAANRFQSANILTSTLAIPTAGTAIAGAESSLIDTSSGAGGVANAGTGLTVSLASGTKAADNIPAGSPNEFLTINLTASNDGAVSVNGLTLSAYDLGTATNIDSVTIYDNGIKQGTAKNVNSDRLATFNFSTPITIAAGTTKSLVVKATIASGTTGNYALGIASASAITTNGASISGSFPIKGNTQAIVSGTSIGTVTMSSVGTTPDPTVNFGDDDVLLASFNLAAANEPIIWESMRLKNGGTNSDSIVSNIRVVIDGDTVATGGAVADKYINVVFDNYLIPKNDTVSVEVYGDIGIANAGNTIDLYIDDINDFVFSGVDYGYGITLVNSATSFQALDAVSDGIVVTLAAGDVTIDMDKVASPAKDIKPDTNDVVLAQFSLLSAGENATITAIGNGADTFYSTGSTVLGQDEMENVELVDIGSGAVYDVTHATSSATSSRVAYTVSDEISLVKGVKRTFQLRADIQGPNDTNGADNDDQLQVVLTSSAFTITGDDSDSNLQSKITPSSVSGSVNTVKTASLTWQTTALTNKTVVPSAKDVVLYRAAVKAGESSDVTLTTVTITATTTTANGFDDNNISQLRAYLNGELVKTVSGTIVEGTASAAAYVTLNNLDSAKRTVKAGQTVTFELRADFASSFNPAAQIQLAITNSSTSIVARDKDSNAVTESVANVNTGSRTLTLATGGTLMVELDTTDTKANANTINLAGSSKMSGDKYLAKLKFTTANEAIKVTDLVLAQEGTAGEDDIYTVDIYNADGTLVKSAGVSSVAGAVGASHFKELNWILPADDVTEYFVGVTTKSINASGDAAGTADHDETIKFTMASSTVLTALGLSANQAVKSTGNDTGSAITMAEDTTNGGSVAAGEYASWKYATSTTATISGAILTSITNAMDNATLGNGNGKTIGKYTFVFDSGSNRIATGTQAIRAQLTTLILNVATTSGIQINSIQAYLGTDTANKTTAVSVNASNEATIDLTSLSGSLEKVTGTVTLTIVGNITGVETADSVQTEIDDLTTDFTYDGYDGWDASRSANSLLTISEVIGGTLTQ